MSVDGVNPGVCDKVKDLMEPFINTKLVYEVSLVFKSLHKEDLSLTSIVGLRGGENRRSWRSGYIHPRSSKSARRLRNRNLFSSSSSRL
jgi:hypothetical protein